MTMHNCHDVRACNAGLGQNAHIQKQLDTEGNRELTSWPHVFSIVVARAHGSDAFEQA